MMNDLRGEILPGRTLKNIQISKRPCQKNLYPSFILFARRPRGTSRAVGSEARRNYAAPTMISSVSHFILNFFIQSSLSIMSGTAAVLAHAG